MKTIPSLLSWLVAAGLAGAQILAPELAPITTKYQTEVATLETQRTNALTQAQNVYLTALATAEKNATATNNVTGVAAITSERNGLGSGLMPPGFPPSLPKELQRARKTYLDAKERIRTAELPRRQTLDGNYLRALATLEARAATNPELARQVKSERDKLLANAPANAKDATGTSKSNSKSVVINGSFDLGDTGGDPGGWTPDDGFKIARDGSNKVVHATAKEIGYRQITQDLTLPERARNVTLSGRVRGKMAAHDPKQPHWGANIAGVFLDQEGQPTKNWLMLDGGNDRGWKPLSTTGKIPEGCKILRVVLVLKHVAGEFDFDDIEVKFR